MADVEGGNETVVVVSCDSHISPRLNQDLRPYCEKKYLAAFDEYAVQYHEEHTVTTAMQGATGLGGGPRKVEAGHHDVHQRLRDMDHDGIAADVLFHGSNGRPIPFVPGGFDMEWDPTYGDFELIAHGMKIYNRFIADSASVAPERFGAFAHIPMWDPDLALKEAEWAKSVGFRGVYFPAPRPGVPDFDNPEWEPFYAACEQLGLSLNTHVGVGESARRSRYADRVHTIPLLMLEIGGWPSRRGVHWLIFSGVFERYPNLKLVMTEQNADWWVASAREWQSIWLTNRQALATQMPNPPIHYMKQNVFIGGSFLSRFEAEDAIANDYAGNVMWGWDYPHNEGCFQPPAFDGDDTAWSKLSLRNTFAGLPRDAVTAMVGLTAIDVYGFDKAALTQVAQRIGSLTQAELHTPLDEIPAHKHPFNMGFRKVAAWG